MSERHIALIVEDDDDMAAEMVDLLRAMDHDAVVAAKRRKALKRLIVNISATFCSTCTSSRIPRRLARASSRACRS